MTDATTTPSTTPVEPTPTVTPSRWQVFKADHPKLAKGATATVAVLAAVGVVQTARTVRANKDDIESARENIGEAASDIASSVTPKSPEA